MEIVVFPRRKVKVLKEQFAHFLGSSFTHLVSLTSFKCRNPVSSSLSPWLRACAWNIVGPSDYVMGARVKCCMEKQLTMRILKLSGLLTGVAEANAGPCASVTDRVCPAPPMLGSLHLGSLVGKLRRIVMSWHSGCWCLG